MKIHCYMKPGHGEPRSQDRLLIQDTILARGAYALETANAFSGCLAIFDGVGGIEGGAYASSYAASQMASFPCHTNEQALGAYLRGISEHLCASGGCATTASGIVFIEKRALLFHAGNTRVWVYDGEYFSRLTDDQTYVAEAAFPISDYQMEKLKNVITGCLGGDRASLADRLVVTDVTEQVAQAAHLLFTCDGVHEYVDPFELEKIVKEEKPLKEVVRLARQNGSDDDCSIMLVSRE